MGVWPKGPVAEAVADEIWDVVSDLNKDVGKRAEQESPLRVDATHEKRQLRSGRGQINALD